MKSLRIREIPEDFTPLQVNISPGRCKLEKVDIVYLCTKYGLQHDTNRFDLRRIWGGVENAKMVFAELNCHVFYLFSSFEVIVLLFGGKDMTFVLYPLFRFRETVKDWNAT